MATATTAAALLLLATACQRAAPDRAGGGTESRDCADVETLRVCWDGARPRVVKRATTTAPARGPAFTCVGDHCEQRHPRMPDAGEWQCMDSAGATICMGGTRAAGAAPSAADPRWFCGARRGGEPDTRVCVDSVARLSRWPRARMALPHAVRRAGAPRLRSRPGRAHAGRDLRRAPPVRRRKPLYGRGVRAGTARARVLAGRRLRGRPLPVRQLR